MCAGNAPTMHMCLLRQTCFLVPVSRHSTGWHESVEQARGLPPPKKAMLTRVECNAHRKTMGPHVHSRAECKACRTTGDIYSTFPRSTRRQKGFNQEKETPKKRLIDNVAILNTAVVAYHLLARLEGFLILQSARRPVGREKVLYNDIPPKSNRRIEIVAGG